MIERVNVAMTGNSGSKAMLGGMRGRGVALGSKKGNLGGRMRTRRSMALQSSVVKDRVNISTKNNKGFNTDYQTKIGKVVDFKPNNSYNLKSPVRTDTLYVTSQFGEDRGDYIHKGLDIDGNKGDSIYAAKQGEVVFSGETEFGGNRVIIDHGNGLLTKYSHLDTMNVVEGDRVNSDTIIGTMGNTGRVYSHHEDGCGTHLDLEVMKDGKYIDPEPLLRGHNIVHSEGDYGSSRSGACSGRTQSWSKFSGTGGCSGSSGSGGCSSTSSGGCSATVSGGYSGSCSGGTNPGLEELEEVNDELNNPGTCGGTGDSVEPGDSEEVDETGNGDVDEELPLPLQLEERYDRLNELNDKINELEEKLNSTDNPDEMREIAEQLVNLEDEKKGTEFQIGVGEAWIRDGFSVGTCSSTNTSGSGPNDPINDLTNNDLRNFMAVVKNGSVDAARALQESSTWQGVVNASDRYSDYSRAFDMSGGNETFTALALNPATTKVAIGVLVGKQIIDAGSNAITIVDNITKAFSE